LSPQCFAVIVDAQNSPRVLNVRWRLTNVSLRTTLAETSNVKTKHLMVTAIIFIRSATIPRRNAIGVALNVSPGTHVVT
jgi:hypothetical protein